MYERFGKYRLLAPIAQGGMAEIFLAKQDGPAGFSKTVVIKRVHKHFSKDEEFVAMFLDEARLAAQLSHTNIVQIFDFGEQDGSYYIAMEYLLGEDIHYLVRAAAKRNERMAANVAATMVSQACAGLHAAHTATDDVGRPLKIVHRDISPSNLFVTYQGAVKVLDFGIAKAEGRASSTRAGTVKGKFVYMSPEQVQNQPLDARSDVWALGASLHEMLTGQRVFFAENDLGILKKLLHDPIPTPRELVPDIPEELEAVVLRALERDLSRRFESAQAMQSALDEFLSTRTYWPAAKLLSGYVKDCVGEGRVRDRSQKVSDILAQEASGPRSAPTAALSQPAATEAAPEDRTGRVDLPAGQEGLPTGQVNLPTGEQTGGGHAAAPVTGATDIKSPPTAATVLKDGLGQTQVLQTRFPPPRRGQAMGNGPWLALAAGLVSIAALALVFGDRLLGVPREASPAGSAGTPVGAALTSATVPPPVAPVVLLPVVLADAGQVVAVPDAGPGPDAGSPVEGDAGTPDAGVAQVPQAAETAVATPAPMPRPAPAPAPAPAAGARTAAVAPWGTLTVNCVPYCHVYLDGKDTGLDSPAVAMKVKAGPHKLKVINPPSGMERELNVLVPAGTEPRVEFIEF